MQNFEERLRTCVRQEGCRLSDIIFRNWVINVSNQNCIYYRLFWCEHNFFILEIKKVTIIWKKNVFFLRHCVELPQTRNTLNTTWRSLYLSILAALYAICGNKTSIVSSSQWWAYKCSKHVEQILSAIKHSVASSWFSSLCLYYDAWTNIHQRVSIISTFIVWLNCLTE